MQAGTVFLFNFLVVVLEAAEVASSMQDLRFIKSVSRLLVGL